MYALQNLKKEFEQKGDNYQLVNIDETIKTAKELDEYYFDELAGIEMYNYLDHITKGFDVEQVKISLNDIELYYYSKFLERINDESMKKYLENDWEIPFEDIHNIKTGEIVKLPDYAKMRHKTHPWAGYSICKVIDMLNSKLPTAENTQATGTAKPQPLQNIIPDLILNELERRRLITKSPLKWVGAKNLCAYFVDNYFKNKTNKWVIVENLFDVKNLAQSKDLYQNTKNGKPKGYQTIDDILKVKDK
ncbi:hypothetical protein AGMMS49525_15410 [Bacteroidia bacterium]|nr:hypothetical protein AGMMS49525_15410 [Bacteroidia bacterium]